MKCKIIVQLNYFILYSTAKHVHGQHCLLCLSNENCVLFTVKNNPIYSI